MSWLKGIKVMEKKGNSLDPVYEEISASGNLMTGMVMQWVLFSYFNIVLLTEHKPHKPSEVSLAQAREDGFTLAVCQCLWRLE